MARIEQINPATANISPSRRNFLRGNISNRALHIRPPWSVNDVLFREICNRCDDCIDACPEFIIRRDDNGYPSVNFSLAGCTYCAECLESCSTGALKGLRSDIDQAWNHSMRIADHCLSVTGVVCRACGDHCEVGAIRFTLLTQGRSLPKINSSSCTGCGQCIPVCPTNAISIHETIERSL
ncbi:MAG: ferredoxin-type protein NapF [Gammaproteobacteria bacterium]|nr:ferredoxin-type protein NapF [Gammaproteobacteria bacterium]MDX2488439.1 ferredoxin-type protein NapF [Gammaproteobacteria bacterium]